MIDFNFPDVQFTYLSRPDLVAWIRNASQAVSAYYGCFPVSHLTLNIRSREGTGIRHGVTYPMNGGLITIAVGRDTKPEQLRDDWMLTHEMVHLAFPSMSNDHHWVEEGSATYVEPVARVMTGNMKAEDLWKQFIKDMPQGEPQSGDQGLDRTHTWGRTYWGGALFLLVADIDIREQTHNKQGLEDALRGILSSGGTINTDWPIEKAFKVGDHATGTNVLETLYRQWRAKPVPVDLNSLWQRLGVALVGGKIVYNERAPLAVVRKSITASKTGSNCEDQKSPSEGDSAIEK